MTIPADTIVKVNPGVIGSGGNPLSLNGVLLSSDAFLLGDRPYALTGIDSGAGIIPAENLLPLTSIYFNGYDNSTVKPGTLYLMRYFDDEVAPALVSGDFAGITVGDLQALSGGLTIKVNGVAKVSAAINFSTITNFSDAAVLLTEAFTVALEPIFTIQWTATAQRFSFICVDESGDGATIEYATGTLAESLLLTLATGAILQQGHDADTPTTAMNRLKAVTQNWVAFTTDWEPDTANKTLFAEWTNAQNQRYVYVPWDTDPQAKVSGSTTAFGVLAKAAAYNAVMPVYNNIDTALFVLGTVASIDFTRANARITAAFKHQSGLTVTCDDEDDAAALLANGYSFYGNYGTDNDAFNFLYDGQITGQWKWLDAFVNQVYLNSQLQLAEMTLLTSMPSIGYNQEGYNTIRLSMTDPITAHVNFGGIRVGVPLDNSQKAQVNSAAGRDIGLILEQQGWYLQILDPGAQARGNRQTPIINFWYTDGGAVQKITIASIDIM